MVPIGDEQMMLASVDSLINQNGAWHLNHIKINWVILSWNQLRTAG